MSTSHLPLVSPSLALAIVLVLGAPLAADAQQSQRAVPDLSAFGAQIPNVEPPKPRHPSRVISEDEMNRYVAALEQIVATGLDREPAFTAAIEQGRMSEANAAAKYSKEMKALMSKQGFTEQSFGEVHQNAMMAYVSLEMAKHQPEMDRFAKESMAQLEAMKGQLPAAQYEKMMQSMGAMKQQQSAVAEVPKQNVALVKKNRAKLERVFDRVRDQP